MAKGPGLGNYNPGSYNITLTKFGPWQSAVLGLATLPAELKGAAMWGQQKVAETYVKIVKGHINAQDLKWVALDERTNSGDPRILVDTESYYSAIKAWRSGFKYHAGVKKDAVNYRGTSIADYATLHEYGWGNMPARPLWGPSLRDMGGKQGIQAIMLLAVSNKIARLAARGFIVTR